MFQDLFALNVLAPDNVVLLSDPCFLKLNQMPLKSITRPFPCFLEEKGKRNASPSSRGILYCQKPPNIPIFHFSPCNSRPLGVFQPNFIQQRSRAIDVGFLQGDLVATRGIVPIIGGRCQFLSSQIPGFT